MAIVVGALKDAAEKVLTVTTNETVRKQANELIEAIDRLLSRDAGQIEALSPDQGIN